MPKKKRKAKGEGSDIVDHELHEQPGTRNGSEESAHTLYEWRRLRGLKSRLAGALRTLDRESGNGPIAFEHFLAKCRDIVGTEDQ